jgi:hypothetical protein
VTTVPMIGTTFGIDTPRARRTDPETSHEAADVNDVEASIGAVLDTLRQYGPTTDEKLVNLMHSLGYQYTEQRIRTARAALVNVELVEFTGDREINPRGRKARVWGATR